MPNSEVSLFPSCTYAHQPLNFNVNAALAVLICKDSNPHSKNHLLQHDPLYHHSVKFVYLVHLRKAGKKNNQCNMVQLS